MKTALILVDIQNDYFQGGKSPLEGSLEAVKEARRLLETFRRYDLPRVHIQHNANRPGKTTFLPGTPGAEIHAEVAPREGEREVVFIKHFPNSFRDTPLLEYLHAQGVERVVVAGMMTHMCVEATTRAAFDYGFECWVAQDACATKALEFDGERVPAQHVHLTVLAALRSSYGKVMCVDDVVKQLVE